MEWPLSCYGLNLNWTSGDNILHGDYSPEELRCEAYAQSRQSGNIDVYKRMVETVTMEQRQKVENAIGNLTRTVALARMPRSFRTQPTASASVISQLENSTTPPNVNVPHTLQGEPPLGPDLPSSPAAGIYPVGKGPMHSLSNGLAPSHGSIPSIPLSMQYGASSGSINPGDDTSDALDAFTFGGIPELPPPC